jgi:hypothetical protein
MVEAVPGEVLPVDGEGVVLPTEDFTPPEAARYLRLVVGTNQKPDLSAGQRWADAKVVGGAEIAAVLGPVWEALRLKQIVPLPAAAGAAANREPLFALFTQAGTRILWGYAPGANMLGEPPAAEKVARLQRHVAIHDTLDGPQGKPQELDVRTLAPAH